MMFKNMTGFPAAIGSLWGDIMNTVMGMLSSHIGLNVISDVYPFDFDSGYGVDGDAQINPLTGEYACKNNGVWTAYAARKGVIAYRVSPANLYANTGSAWVDASSGGGGGSADTLYNADGTIADPRTVNLQNSLAFNSTTTHPATPASVFYNLNHIYSTGANLSTQLILADASPSFSSYYTYSGVTRYKEDTADISASSCSWAVSVGDTWATHSCIVGLDAIDGYGAYLGLYDSLNGFTGLRTPNPTKTVLIGENGVYKGAEYADGDAYSALFTDNSLIHKKFTDTTYLKIADAVSTPTGSVSAFAGSVVPAGWLFCDGSDIDRTTYAALFTVIGTDYGVGDGSTTFTLPDLRGEFVRGLDAGRGIDTGRVLGSFQADELKAHTHSYTETTQATDTQSGGDTYYIDAAAGTTGSTGGTETRPRNIAMNYMIKT